MEAPCADALQLELQRTSLQYPQTLPGERAAGGGGGCRHLLAALPWCQETASDQLVVDQMDDEAAHPQGSEWQHVHVDCDGCILKISA